MGVLYDISPPLSSATPVFPGDPPLVRSFVSDVAAGDSSTISALSGTVHAGAHVDSPRHLFADAPSVDQLSLDHFLGTCQVVKTGAEREPEIVCADLAGEISERIVIVDTGSWSDKSSFPSGFPAFSLELVELFKAKGVITAGTDAPSVDHASSLTLPVHRALLGAGIVILEGLALQNVPPGRYELIALPLKLAEFEASPIRAILRS